MLRTTVLLFVSSSTVIAQWSPYGGGFGGPRPIMSQYGGGYGGGMPFGMQGSGGQNIRFSPQSYSGSQFGTGAQFGSSYGSGMGSAGSPFGSSFGGASSQFGNSPYGAAQMGGSSFPPYGMQSGSAQQFGSSQLVLPPGAISAPGFSGQFNGLQSMGPGSSFASSIDNSITSMNAVNSVPFGGSGSGFAGSGAAASDRVRRVIPPFLQGADKETEDRFYSIVQNPTWSAAEKERKVQEFIATLDSTRQNTYEQFRREAASTQKTKRDKVHSLVEQMSPEAQQQFQKVSALMTNPGISDQERLSQISQLYSKLSPEVRSEFDAKFSGL